MKIAPKSVGDKPLFSEKEKNSEPVRVDTTVKRVAFEQP